ncbi:MAG: response regulator [Candidatus Moranbacteria bacterium]|nr:response regulator [Candidatus Moranbacteria bacterium]
MPKILFVEDDQFIAEIYKKKFETSGLDADNVGTGKAVLRAVKEDSYDLVLLDLVIPEMSGKEVLKELRTNDEYDKNLKIVVFSNLSSAEDRDECLQLGANGFISKTDYTPSEVVDEIQRFLRQFSEQAKNGSRESGDADGSVSGKHDRKRILFIEDEAVFIEMFGKRLRDEGYEVLIMNEGASGLEAALAGDFDMLITDVMMPSVGGHEIVLRLRQTDHGKNIPIILLSASLEDEQLSEIAESSAVDRAFLKTRITPSELAYAVNAVFRERS